MLLMVFDFDPFKLDVLFQSQYRTQIVAPLVKMESGNEFSPTGREVSGNGR